MNNSRRPVAALFGLSCLLWGTPYLLIAVAVEDLPPATVAFLRVAIAALFLVVVVGLGPLHASLRGRWLAVAVIAVVQFTGPVLLISHAETSIPSSLAGSLIASEPLWIALLAARYDASQRTAGSGVPALVAAFAGVAILLGAEPGGLVGSGMVVAAAVSYAVATLLVGRWAATVPPLHLVTGALMISAATLLPVAVLAPAPTTLPSSESLAAVAVLGVVCTAVAFPVWFELIARAGAARAGLVTYLSPVVAVGLGVVVLDESLNAYAPVGLMLILTGTWFASRRPNTSSPSPLTTHVDHSHKEGS